MTGKEKILAALSGEGTSEIPAVICYEDIYIRDHWSDITSCPWWYAYSPDLEQDLAWRREAIEKTGQDWFRLHPSAPKAFRERRRREAKPDGVYETDLVTGETFKLDPPAVGGWGRSGGLHSVRPEKLADSFEEIDRILGSPGPFDPKTPGLLGTDGLARGLLPSYGNDFYTIDHVSVPMWTCYGLWGFEGMMTMIATRQDLVRRLCERRLEAAIHQVREAAALGVNGIWLEDCMTDMISPEDFSRLNVASLKPLVEEIRSAGLHSLYYFCGDPKGKWDLLLSAGADALSLEESKKGFTVDIEEVVDHVQGRTAVLGNVDAIHLLPRATEEELRMELKRQIAAGRRNGNRFIMSIGSPVTPETSVDRVRQYCDMTHEMGRGSF